MSRGPPGSHTRSGTPPSLAHRTGTTHPGQAPENPAVGAATILGGDSLTDFALAVLAGIVVGHLSTVFTTGPLTLWLERFAKAPQPMRERTAGAAARSKSRRTEPKDTGAVV